MTPHDWASKKVEKVPECSGGLDVISSNDAARLLRLEHQRAVRVVKRLKSVADLEYGNDRLEGYQQACDDILHKLKDGRT